MIKSKVRCWKVEHWRKGEKSPDQIYITYPENNSGHNLLSCLRCGHIYSVSVTKLVYIGSPLVEKLKGMCCIQCGTNLDRSLTAYPDRYFVDGQILEFKRPKEIPPASDSLVMEFDEIYGWCVVANAIQTAKNKWAAIHYSFIQHSIEGWKMKSPGEKSQLWSTKLSYGARSIHWPILVLGN